MALKKRVLFLSYCFPPLKYPRSIQIARVLKYFDFPFTMVSATPGSDDLSDIDPTIPSVPARSDREFIAVPHPQGSRRWMRFLKSRRLLSLIQPDPYRFWASEAGRFVLNGSLTDRHDVLVSFGQPMSDHLAALRIKRETGIPWIAHFSDPWSQSPFRSHPLHRIWDRYYEANVVRAVDHIIVTSEETKRLLSKSYFTGIEQKISVLPHAYDRDLYGKVDPIRREELHLAHVGNFYGHRSPEPFLTALEALLRQSPNWSKCLKIHFYGQVPKESIERVNSGTMKSIVRFHGVVSFSESLRKMSEADGLILIDADADESPFLPSKLIDYLGASRPIFGLTPKGASATVLSRLNHPTVSPRDRNAITAALSTFLESLKQSRDVSYFSASEFDAHSVAYRFQELISQVAARAPTIHRLSPF